MMTMMMKMRSSLVAITVHLLLFLPILAIISTPVALADVKTDEHGGGSSCYNCHVANYPVDLNAAVLHNMTAADAWASCTSAAGCHANLNASGTVHDVVDCKGCHAPLHVSFNTNGTAAWLFVYRINRTDAFGSTWYKPTPPLTWNKTIFMYTSTNSSELGADFSTWGGQIHWAWTNASGKAGDISASTRYLVCLNCHFVTTNPAEAGLTKMIQGRVMIAVPEFSLKLSPHSITDSALREAVSETNQWVAFKSDEVRTASGIILGIGLIGLVLWRRRPYST